MCQLYSASHRIFAAALKLSTETKVLNEVSQGYVSEVTLEEKPTLWYALAILAGVTLCSKVKHSGLLGSLVSYSEIKVF